MTTFNHFTGHSPLSLTDTLDAFAEVGIDPAFDAECEELERQFAEIRFTFENN